MKEKEEGGKADDKVTLLTSDARHPAPNTCLLLSSFCFLL